MDNRDELPARVETSSENTEVVNGPRKKYVRPKNRATRDCKHIIDHKLDINSLEGGIGARLRARRNPGYLLSPAPTTSPSEEEDGSEEEEEENGSEEEDGVEEEDDIDEVNNIDDDALSTDEDNAEYNPKRRPTKKRRLHWRQSTMSKQEENVVVIESAVSPEDDTDSGSDSGTDSALDNDLSTMQAGKKGRQRRRQKEKKSLQRCCGVYGLHSPRACIPYLGVTNDKLNRGRNHNGEFTKPKSLGGITNDPANRPLVAFFFIFGFPTMDSGQRLEAALLNPCRCQWLGKSQCVTAAGKTNTKSIQYRSWDRIFRNIYILIHSPAFVQYHLKIAFFHPVAREQWDISNVNKTYRSGFSVIDDFRAGKFLNWQVMQKAPPLLRTREQMLLDYSPWWTDLDHYLLLVQQRVDEVTKKGRLTKGENQFCCRVPEPYGGCGGRIHAGQLILVCPGCFEFSHGHCLARHAWSQMEVGERSFVPERIHSTCLRCKQALNWKNLIAEAMHREREGSAVYQRLRESAGWDSRERAVRKSKEIKELRPWAERKKLGQFTVDDLNAAGGVEDEGCDQCGLELVEREPTCQKSIWKAQRKAYDTSRLIWNYLMKGSFKPGKGSGFERNYLERMLLQDSIHGHSFREHLTDSRANAWFSKPQRMKKTHVTLDALRRWCWSVGIVMTKSLYTTPRRSVEDKNKDLREHPKENQVLRACFRDLPPELKEKDDAKRRKRAEVRRKLQITKAAQELEKAKVKAALELEKEKGKAEVEMELDTESEAEEMKLELEAEIESDPEEMELESESEAEEIEEIESESEA